MLSSGTMRLPKKLRQVAIYLWQHPTVVALGTVTNVAKQAGVNPRRWSASRRLSAIRAFPTSRKCSRLISAAAGAERGASGNDDGARSEATVSSTASSNHRPRRFPHARPSRNRGFRNHREQRSPRRSSSTSSGRNAHSAASSYVSLALSKLGIRNSRSTMSARAAFEHLRSATSPTRSSP